MDFAPTMVPKKEPEQLLFLERLFYRFLKDVHNKTLTFEVRRDLKMDPERDKSIQLLSSPKNRKIFENIGHEAPQRDTKNGKKSLRISVLFLRSLLVPTRTQNEDLRP